MKAKLTAMKTATALFLGIALTSAQETTPSGESRRQSSLTEQKTTDRPRVLDARSAIEDILGENAELRERIAVSELTIAELQKNLTIANSEAELFQHTVEDLKLRLEALGIGGATGNSQKLGSRLLKAVNELAIAEEDRSKLKEALIELQEAVLHFSRVAVTTDPGVRLSLETGMRDAAKVLGTSAPGVAVPEAVPATLSDGIVVAIRDDLALAVINLGSSHGVKVGMPFQIIRDKTVVGIVRVVDVREKIAGAVIQDLRSDKNQQKKLKVGDRVKVDVRI